MRGQELFLAASEVLQHALLPCLSAPDLLRLGLTCKPLLSWVLSTPPTLWQVKLPFNWADQLTNTMPCSEGQHCVKKQQVTLPASPDNTYCMYTCTAMYMYLHVYMNSERTSL